MARQDLLGLSVSPGVAPRARPRLVRLLHRSSSALVLGLLLLGALVLWVGMPVGWLWIGSQVQGATGSLGVAVAVMLVGVAVTIALLMPALVWLNDRHRVIQVARGREDTERFVLETVLVVSALAALVVFAAWFLFFAGATPLPFYGNGA